MEEVWPYHRPSEAAPPQKKPWKRKKKEEEEEEEDGGVKVTPDQRERLFSSLLADVSEGRELLIMHFLFRRGRRRRRRRRQAYPPFPFPIYAWQSP